METESGDTEVARLIRLLDRAESDRDLDQTRHQEITRRLDELRDVLGVGAHNTVPDGGVLTAIRDLRERVVKIETASSANTLTRTQVMWGVAVFVGGIILTAIVTAAIARASSPPPAPAVVAPQKSSATLGGAGRITHRQGSSSLPR
jgi:hypothetical protein